MSDMSVEAFDLSIRSTNSEELLRMYNSIANEMIYRLTPSPTRTKVASACLHSQLALGSLMVRDAKDEATVHKSSLVSRELLGVDAKPVKRPPHWMVNRRDPND